MELNVKMRGFLYAVASVVLILLLFPIILVTLIVAVVVSFFAIIGEAIIEAFEEV